MGGVGGTAGLPWGADLAVMGGVMGRCQSQLMVVCEVGLGGWISCSKGWEGSGGVGKEGKGVGVVE